MSVLNIVPRMVTTDQALDKPDYIDIVFAGPPGPVGPCFVDVENSQGQSISFGKWVQRPDGFWALRIPKE